MTARPTKNAIAPAVPDPVRNATRIATITGPATSPFIYSPFGPFGSLHRTSRLSKVTSGMGKQSGLGADAGEAVRDDLTLTQIHLRLTRLEVAVAEHEEALQRVLSSLPAPRDAQRPPLRLVR